MRQFSRVFVIAAASAILAAGVATLVCQARIPVVPDREDEGGWRAIPLDSVYSTRGQKGVLDAQTSLDEVGRQDLREMEQAAPRATGATNIYLVRGDDLADAVRATKRTHLGPRRADVPVTPIDEPSRAPFWLAVYLGNRHDLLVESVRRRSGLVRLTYRRPEKGGAPDAWIPYFVWVPLGQLEPGRYTFEIFDAGRDDVALMRRVWITQD